MKRRIILAYFGDPDASARLAKLAAADVGSDLVVVAIDLGQAIPLMALRDGALAAGARRCHVIDAREEFARDVVVPALQSRDADPRRTVTHLARPFVRRKLEALADIEQADVVHPAGEVPWMSLQPRTAAAGPASLDLRFADDEPYALNDIPMTLVELMDSIETISGEAAIDVLRQAYAALDRSGEGRVTLRVPGGVPAAASTVAG